MHVAVWKEVLSAELAVHVVPLLEPSAVVELNMFEVAFEVVSAVCAVDADKSAALRRPGVAEQCSAAVLDGPVELPDALAVSLDVLSCPGVLAARSGLSILTAGLDAPVASAVVLSAAGAFPVADQLGDPYEDLTAAYGVQAVQRLSEGDLAGVQDVSDVPEE